MWKDSYIEQRSQLVSKLKAWNMNIVAVAYNFTSGLVLPLIKIALPYKTIDTFNALTKQIRWVYRHTKSELGHFDPLTFLFYV